MRARALRPRRWVSPWRGLRRPSVAALLSLPGRDADGRLRELAAARAAARPLLGALSAALVARRLYEPLGYRSLGDFGRERLGVGARTVREWARVGQALEALPRLQAALLAGELSWTVARRVVGLVTPATEAACLETVRGRTVRAVAAIAAAVRRAEAQAAGRVLRVAGDPSGGEPGGEGSKLAGEPGGEGGELAGEEGDEAEGVLVRLPCTEREFGFWYAAVELARRVAGEQLRSGSARRRSPPRRRARSGGPRG
jgi:hypothetical protein